MEWEAAALVLSGRPYGESGAVIRLLSEEHGVMAGLVRGGNSRRQAALWQPGNLILALWRARLPDQLGNLSAELVQSPAARLLDHPMSLSLLTAMMALADGALPEHEAHPDLFLSLVRLTTAIAIQPDDPPFAMAIRWECALLSALGYGLSLDRCALTGTEEGLAYVSPKTGRAISADHAGAWRDRLLPMPNMLRDEGSIGSPAEWSMGFNLTGYFLAKHVFGVRNAPMPDARYRLVRRLSALVSSEESGNETNQ